MSQGAISQQSFAPRPQNLVGWYGRTRPETNWSRYREQILWWPLEHVDGQIEEDRSSRTLPWCEKARGPQPGLDDGSSDPPNQPQTGRPPPAEEEITTTITLVMRDRTGKPPRTVAAANDRKQFMMAAACLCEDRAHAATSCLPRRLQQASWRFASAAAHHHHHKGPRSGCRRLRSWTLEEVRRRRTLGRCPATLSPAAEGGKAR